MEAFGPDYFERGVEFGVSCYQNYRWMPERSRGEARAFLAAMGVNGRRPTVTDFGCAKGFFVRALLGLGCEARGVDVSAYARGCATLGTGGRLVSPEDADGLAPTELGFCKDVLEHATEAELPGVLARLRRLARRWLVIVPYGDSGIYRLAEYERDVTHVLRWDEERWSGAFADAGFVLESHAYRVPGLKDKWADAHPYGNGFYFLRGG